MDRAERALLRIERAIERGSMTTTTNTDGRDEQLRARVVAALGELDEIIREAEHG